MKAIYRGHLATITECMGNPHGDGREDGAILDNELWVSFGDPDLIVDPTDAQVAAVKSGPGHPVSGRHPQREDRFSQRWLGDGPSR